MSSVYTSLQTYNQFLPDPKLISVLLLHVYTYEYMCVYIYSCTHTCTCISNLLSPFSLSCLCTTQGFVWPIRACPWRRPFSPSAGIHWLPFVFETGSHVSSVASDSLHSWGWRWTSEPPTSTFQCWDHRYVVITPVLFKAELECQTQGSVYAELASHQLSYIPRPRDPILAAWHISIYL